VRQAGRPDPGGSKAAEAGVESKAGRGPRRAEAGVGSEAGRGPGWRRPADPLVVALVGLTFATGLVDAVSFLGLGHVFAANMTGNVVLLGFAFAGVGGFTAAPSLVALATFLVGAAVGGRMAASLESRREQWLGIALGTECLVTGLAVVSAVGVHTGDESGRRFVVIGLLAGAMGVRNATVRRLAVPDLTTTVLTMTITGLGADSALGAHERQRLARRIAAVLAMLGGAVAGGLMIRDGLLLPLVMTVVLLVVLGSGYRIVSTILPSLPPAANRS
jgi:uncharacterized membrane protein YoaK (UPF0700 family)